MAENQTEMSLDEVLSSIKQMVIDKDPPVLELTDMISSDGSIVKVGNNSDTPSAKPDMKSFLRLAQENGKETEMSLFNQQEAKLNEEISEKYIRNSNSSTERITNKKDPSQVTISQDCVQNSDKTDKSRIELEKIVKEVATPIVEDWLVKNLPSLVKQIVSEKISEKM